VGRGQPDKVFGERVINRKYCMPNDENAFDGRVKTSTALRHVLVFQVKLAADALRDFLLSPMSLIAFAIDAATKPPLEKSLYLRLMRYGRRTDRMINLFDDYEDDGELSIDRAVDEVEGMFRPAQGGDGHRNTHHAENTRADDCARRED